MDRSVVTMQVTVSIAIMQLEVSVALMQVTISVANILLPIFIVVMQVGVSVAIIQVVFSGFHCAHDCFYCNYVGDCFCCSYAGFISGNFCYRITVVMGFFTKKWQIRWIETPRIYSLFMVDWVCYSFTTVKGVAHGEEYGLEFCGETGSKVWLGKQWRRCQIKPNQ